MSRVLTLVPAYGRDYKSEKEVRAAWAAGTDFLIACFMHPYDGKPTNKRQCDGEGTAVAIRFKGLRSQTWAIEPETPAPSVDLDKALTDMHRGMSDARDKLSRDLDNLTADLMDAIRLPTDDGGE